MSPGFKNAITDLSLKKNTTSFTNPKIKPLDLGALDRSAQKMSFYQESARSNRSLTLRILTKRRFTKSTTKKVEEEDDSDQGSAKQENLEKLSSSDEEGSVAKEIRIVNDALELFGIMFEAEFSKHSQTQIENGEVYVTRE